MSVAHLTSQQVELAVLDVLSGKDIGTTAAAYGMDAADLTDAISAYHAGGRAALDHHDHDAWYHVRIQFPDWRQAEAVAARHLLPTFDLLQETGAIAGWWFLRKHPHWRIRFQHAHRSVVGHQLDDLVRHGVIHAWNPGIYEPETTAFGGPTGMGIIHKLFCADSREVLQTVANADVRRRETSMLVLTALFHAAGLDWFERGDVFAQVARLRPLPRTAARENAHRLSGLASAIRPLLDAQLAGDAHGTDRLMPSRPWLEAHRAAGRALHDAAATGELRRGLRAVLAQNVIFHWNRFGLAANTQAVLAAAATTAILEGTTTPWTPTP